MLDDDIRSKHGTRKECIVRVGRRCVCVCVWGGGGGGSWRDEDQECLTLSFPMHVGSKRIPNAFMKADNRRGEEQCVLVDKGKQEKRGLIESACAGRLTGSLRRGKWWRNSRRENFVSEE